MSNETKIVTPELSHSFMFGRVRDFISGNFDFSPQHAAHLLFEFEDTHGDDAVIKMYGFLRYASVNKMSYGKRTTTIAHDLKIRNDRFGLPKTDEYYNYCNL